MKENETAQQQKKCNKPLALEHSTYNYTCHLPHTAYCCQPETEIVNSSEASLLDSAKPLGLSVPKNHTATVSTQSSQPSTKLERNEI